MTFHAALQHKFRSYRLAHRLALLTSARRKLQAAAARSTGRRADMLCDLAAYADMIAARLWPQRHGGGR